MENSNKHLHELCTQIAEASAVSVSEATVCRLNQTHVLTRKKTNSFTMKHRGKSIVHGTCPSVPKGIYETGFDART